MSGLVKRNDAWVTFKEAWVKRSGIWTKAQQVYQRQSGVWTLVQTPPQPPPQAPTVSLEVTAQKAINVGVRYPASNDQATIKKIKVMVSRTAMPTSQFGSGTVKEADLDWRGEFWSDWVYDYSAQDYYPPVTAGSGLGDADLVVSIATGEPDPNGTPVFRIHPDTSILDHKIWPPNVDKTGLEGALPIPTGQWYYFAGWTLDTADQWSVGTFNKVFVPQGAITGVIHKEANFAPTASGYLLSGDIIGEPGGDLLTVGNTGAASQGVLFFSNTITNTVGADGALTEVPTGTIRLSRDNDSYAPSANVWMYWHDIATAGGANVPSNHRFDITKIGTIAKGETKSLPLPAWSASVWNTQIKGVGFGWSPSPVTSDNSILLGVDRDPRSGEINLNWNEET